MPPYYTHNDLQQQQQQLDTELVESCAQDVLINSNNNIVVAAGEHALNDVENKSPMLINRNDVTGLLPLEVSGRQNNENIEQEIALSISNKTDNISNDDDDNDYALRESIEKANDVVDDDETILTFRESPFDEKRNCELDLSKDNKQQEDNNDDRKKGEMNSTDMHSSINNKRVTLIKSQTKDDEDGVDDEDEKEKVAKTTQH